MTSVPVRMIATDLDGTLLRDDKTVSQRTLDSLDLARSAGVIVTIVTGRPPRWLAPVIHQTGWHGLAISANGAVLIDLERKRIEETFPFPHDALITTIQATRKLLPDVRFAAEYAHVGSAVPLVDPLAEPSDRTIEDVVGFSLFGHEPGYRAGLLALPPAPLEATIEELVEPGNVVKLLARAPEEHTEHPDDVAIRIQAELIEAATVTHSTANGVLLEISAPGVNKATGLARLGELHGIAQENIVAIGDMPNDVAMLEWAGQGYAVANAHGLVRDVAGNNVVASNENDGVADLIEQIVASQES